MIRKKVTKRKGVKKVMRKVLSYEDNDVEITVYKYCYNKEIENEFDKLLESLEKHIKEIKRLAREFEALKKNEFWLW